MSEIVCHSGRVERIEDHRVLVRIIQRSACAGCHAKSMCSSAESKEKIIEAYVSNPGMFHINEEVELCSKSSLGLEAVLLAFVIPSIIIIASVVVGTTLQWSETIVGLVGLLLLVPYYLVLYFLRNKLKRKFIFTLKKLN